MRKYTLTTDRLKQQTPEDIEKLYDWCLKERAPSIHTIVKIELFPKIKQVTYYLATGVETKDGVPCITTTSFTMPLRTRPNWVDMCTMSEV